MKGLRELRAGRAAQVGASRLLATVPTKPPECRQGEELPRGAGPSLPHLSHVLLNTPHFHILLGSPLSNCSYGRKRGGSSISAPRSLLSSSEGSEQRRAARPPLRPSVRASVPTCPPASAAVTDRAPAAKCCGNAMQTRCKGGKKPFTNKPTNQPRAVPRPGLRCRTVSPQRQKIKPSLPTSSGCQLGTELKQTGRPQSFACGLDRRTGCDCSSVSPGFPVPHS